MNKEEFLKARDYRLFREMRLSNRGKEKGGIEWWEFNGGGAKVLITLRRPFLTISSDIQPMNITLRDPEIYQIGSWISTAENYLLFAGKVIAPTGVQGIYSLELSYGLDAMMLIKNLREDEE